MASISTSAGTSATGFHAEQPEPRDRGTSSHGDTSLQRCSEYYQRGYWRREDLWTTVTNRAAADTQRVALIEGERSINFGQMVDAAISIGAGLRQQGIGIGDVVLIHARNSIDATLSLLACLGIGAVVTPIPPMFSATQVASICVSAKAKLLIVLGDEREIAQAVEGARMAKTVKAIVVPDSYTESPDTLAWSRLWEHSDSGSRMEVDPDAVALMVYSSGTTGAPKGVMHSSNTVRYAIEQRARLHGVDAGMVALVASQFGFVGSAVFGLLAGPVLGMTSVLMRSWNGDEAVRLIERYRIEYGLLMPTHVHDVLHAQTLGRADVSSFKRCAMGALSSERRLRVRRELCPNPLPAYGMSECLGFTSCSPEDGDAAAVESDGYPFPGTEVLIADADGNPVATGVDGEILVRGPSRFLGYHGEPRLTVEAITADGYFRTGDRGRLDAHGNVKFIAREKDIIRRGGVTIVPGDLEAVLTTHPRIEHVAIVGLPDPRLGERACACVITHDRQPLTLEETCAFLEEKGVARYSWPERIELFASFPRSASLKVQKGVLVERLERSDAENCECRAPGSS